MTRHANIFAILFHIATAEEQEKILENVIKNDAIPAITTPYFNFFELDMLCQTGNSGVRAETKCAATGAACWNAAR